MRLKELRKNKKLSQEEMAKILNISQSNYSKYELGITQLNIETLKKIADYFNVSTDYLLEREIKHIPQLKVLRKNHNLTQEEVAKKNNMTRATYGNYENGKTQPDIQDLIKLADFYNVSLDYLCEHETKNVFDYKNMSSIQKDCIEMIKTLNDNECKSLITFTKYLKNEIKE